MPKKIRNETALKMTNNNNGIPLDVVLMVNGFLQDYMNNNKTKKIKYNEILRFYRHDSITVNPMS